MTTFSVSWFIIIYQRESKKDGEASVVGEERRASRFSSFRRHQLITTVKKGLTIILFFRHQLYFFNLAIFYLTQFQLHFFSLSLRFNLIFLLSLILYTKLQLIIYYRQFKVYVFLLFKWRLVRLNFFTLSSNFQIPDFTENLLFLVRFLFVFLSLLVVYFWLFLVLEIFLSFFRIFTLHWRQIPYH